LSLCLFSPCSHYCSDLHQAVVVVPIADLALQKIQKVYPEKKVADSYQSICLEGQTFSAYSCPRAHQLLFNEQVTVVRQEGDELLVKVPNCFYMSKGKKRNQYWTHKANLKILSGKLKTTKIPKPINFYTKNIKQSNQNIITLLLPFYDKKNKRTFSAGTRFVQADNKKQISVWALNKKASAFDLLKIPESICLKNNTLLKKNRRKLFVNLLKKWVHQQPKKFIPYVWGGCSFTRPYEKTMIHAKKNKKNEKTFWQTKKLKIASGLDCSGAILRGTQIFNIPYFCKNSISAKQHLEKLKNYKELKNGDLLYIQGHIMIVSDKKNNKLIEARSHYSGYGKLQEKKIGEIFKGIKSYQQLITLCNANKHLVRIDSSGKAENKRKNGTFLKLPA